MAAQIPYINTSNIDDQYVRQNFESLKQYFRDQNQLLDFKFLEVVFTAAETGRKVAHGLNYIPLDIFVSHLTGSGKVTFQYKDFDKSNLSIDASGPCWVRFLVGTSDKITSTEQIKDTDSQAFSADPAPSALSSLVPTVQKFTLDSGTYALPTARKPLYLRVRMVGGGGGGGGSGQGAGAGGVGGSGGTTTFGTSLLTAAGGGGGGAATSGNIAGGAITVNAPAVDVASRAGAYGGGVQYNGTQVIALCGGPGGASPFGGNGANNQNAGAGSAAVANTGSGGGGGGCGTVANTNYSGGGGGAGGYIDVIIANPADMYAYSVGVGGTAGTAGTNGAAGGAGGSGYIEVTEYY